MKNLIFNNRWTFRRMIATMLPLFAMVLFCATANAQQRGAEAPTKRSHTIQKIGTKSDIGTLSTEINWVTNTVTQQSTSVSAEEYADNLANANIKNFAKSLDSSQESVGQRVADLNAALQGSDMRAVYDPRNENEIKIEKR